MQKEPENKNLISDLVTLLASSLGIPPSKIFPDQVATNNPNKNKEVPEEDNKEIFRYGFIAVDQLSPENLGKPEQRVACAIVSLSGEDFAKYAVDLIFTFGYDSRAIAQKLLDLNCKRFYIDQENLLWLAPDWQTVANKIYSEYKDSTAQLIGRERDSDRLRRQCKFLETPLQRGEVIFSKQVPEVLKNQTENLGNGVADAVAGAIEVCRERVQFAQKISATNPRQPKRWLGLPRWNESIILNKQNNNQ